MAPMARAPNRDGVSDEVGLLKEWSPNGPKMLWKIPLGEGFSGISVAQGRVYTMFSKGNDEFVVCLNATDGQGKSGVSDRIKITMRVKAATVPVRHADD